MSNTTVTEDKPFKRQPHKMVKHTKTHSDELIECA